MPYDTPYKRIPRAWNYEIDGKSIPCLCLNPSKKYPKSQITLTQKKAAMIIADIELIKRFADNPQAVIKELQAKQQENKPKPATDAMGESLLLDDTAQDDGSGGGGF
jgi:hypothetical protein